KRPSGQRLECAGKSTDDARSIDVGQLVVEEDIEVAGGDDVVVKHTRVDGGGTLLGELNLARDKSMPAADGLTGLARLSSRELGGHRASVQGITAVDEQVQPSAAVFETKACMVRRPLVGKHLVARQRIVVMEVARVGKNRS